MLDWRFDKSKIIDRIASDPTDFKVVLKTLDDPNMLRMWLDHHVPLVGTRRIIIADNGSTNQEVINIYKSISEDIFVFIYSSDPNSGFHNVIHDRAAFKLFYDSLLNSCAHSTLIDTDEFIFPISTATLEWNAQVLEEIMQQSGNHAVPGIWLHGIPHSPDTTFIGTDQNHLAAGVAWGKPFVPTSYSGGGFRIHNVQFPQEIFRSNPQSFIVLLHLNQYSTEQRLAANKRKLIARGAASPTMTYDEIAAIDHSRNGDPTVGRLIKEISDLQSGTVAKSPSSLEILAGQVRFKSQGYVELGDESTKKNLISCIAHMEKIIDTSFKDKINQPGVKEFQNAPLTPAKKEPRMIPHMSPDERDLLARILQDKRFVLEFGCGGSTVMSAECNVKKIASVESDKEFLEKVQSYLSDQPIQFIPIHIDIGPTRDWGAPADNTRAILWPDYYRKIWKLMIDRPDVVFVDGRFRVACALSTIINCAKNTTIVIHDYADRPFYHVVEEFCSVEARVDTLVVLRIKPKFDWKRLSTILLDHALDYR